MQALAEEMHVPLATLRKWRLNGQGPPGFRAGRHVLYRRVDVERWIEERLAAERHGAA